MDRVEWARKQIAKHGPVYTDRFGSPHPRPEVAIVRDGTDTFAKLCKQLRLDTDEIPKRPRGTH
jgi:hypothetical protein